MKDAQEKADAFQASRHFWKFDVDGWDRQVSLKEVEQAIKAKTEEKFKLYNFLRPSKREEIQGQVAYLQDVKKDIQKQLAAKELSIEKSLGSAEVGYKIANTQAAHTKTARAEHGKVMPAPIHQGNEIVTINDIAVRHHDAQLLNYVYEQIKDKLMENPSPRALSRLKGSAIMARMNMYKAGERANATEWYKYSRQLPVRDANGLDNVKSLRESEPKGALETLIRYFTDSVAQKRDLRELRNVALQQVVRAQDQSKKAVEYSFVLDKILNDHCRAAKVSEKQVVPMLDERQIAELREYADKMYPFSRIRQDFTDAARQGEEALRQREAYESARQSEQARANDPATRSRESSSQETTRSDRSDSYSRGR
jgi:hypothetical protein